MPIIIKRDGKDGHHGVHGRNAETHEAVPGGNGAPGKNATSAPNLHVLLQSTGSRYLRVSINGVVETTAHVDDIDISACGGKGGDGGYGGRGSDGQYAAWGNGGDGYDGGNGGHGGNGGNGGHVVVETSLEDAHLLMLLRNVNTAAGANGLGGYHGEGGFGGGTSDLYRVPGTLESEHSRIGAKGRDGNDGYSGSYGLRGSLGYRIDGQTYSALYQPWLQAFMPASGNGIFAPGGTDYGINWLHVNNQSEMPTPNRRIMVGVEGNNLIEFDAADEAALSSVRSSSYLCKDNYTRPLIRFGIKRQFNPAPGQIFYQQTTIMPYAYMAGINRPLPNFIPHSLEPFLIEIRHPAELTISAIPYALAPGVRRYFEFCVRNIGLQPLDMQVKLALTKRSSCRITWADADGNRKLVDTNGIFFYINELPGCSWTRISGTLGVDYTTTINYEKPGFTCALTANDTLLQIGQFEVQLTEADTDNQDAEFVLVINANVTVEEINFWREFVATLGRELRIWNVSLYQGFSYDKLPQGTIVIMFDNDYTHNLTGEITHVTATLPAGAVFAAAKHQNVATYVIGNHRNTWYQTLVPNQAEFAKSLRTYASRTEYLSALKTNPAVANFSVKVQIAMNYGPFAAPDMDNLVRRLHECVEMVRASKPHQTHYFLPNLNVQQIQSGFNRRFNVGDGVIIEGPNQTRAFTAIRNALAPDAMQRNDDIFTLFKLMDFHKKLRYFEMLSADPELTTGKIYKLLLQAIIADLADEQEAVRRDMCFSGLSDDAIRASIILLPAVIATLTAPGIHVYEATLILMFKVLLDDYQTVFARGEQVTRICNKLIADLLHNIPEYQTQYEYIKEVMHAEAGVFTSIKSYVRNPLSGIGNHEFSNQVTARDGLWQGTRHINRNSAVVRRERDQNRFFRNQTNPDFHSRPVLHYTPGGVNKDVEITEIEAANIEIR